MAMSPVQRYLFRSMFEHHVLPSGGALLEIGEANWYGQINRDELLGDIEKYVSDPERRAALARRVIDLPIGQTETYKFDVVKIFYDVFLSPTEMQAVDFEGTPAAHRMDLNRPLALSRRFDVVVNHGTAEHIFNIAQVFRTMHDYTVPGGLMMHESPFTGWVDHGFYSPQPTLFWDLAEYNQYQLRGMFIEDLTARNLVQIRTREEIYELARAKRLPENSMLFTVLSKDVVERPFQVPIQGYYRKSLPKSGMTAWEELR
jgi:hypothetical protein